MKRKLKKEEGCWCKQKKEKGSGVKASKEGKEDVVDELRNSDCGDVEEEGKVHSECNNEEEDESGDEGDNEGGDGKGNEYALYGDKDPDEEFYDAKPGPIEKKGGYVGQIRGIVLVRFLFPKMLMDAWVLSCFVDSEYNKKCRREALFNMYSVSKKDKCLELNLKLYQAVLRKVKNEPLLPAVKTAWSKLLSVCLMCKSMKEAISKCNILD